MSDEFQIGFDTETGGVYPAVNPLLSIALVPSWDAPETTIYVLPEPGKLIEPDAARINGYTPEGWAARGAVPLHRAMLIFAASLQQLLAEKKEARLVAHNAGFDRSFVEEAARPFQIELPGRYQWECSMSEFGSLINDGLLPAGGRSLARLGELAGLWPVGERPAVHDVTEDARAAMQGYRWLREKRRSAPPRFARTDEEIIAQTDMLAFQVSLLDGYAFEAGYKFHEHSRLADNPMPRQAKYWAMARQAQILLTETDPEDALP